MANDDHIAQLMKGVAAWNKWRKENSDIRPDLGGANLYSANLYKANLAEADLSEANLSRANLANANLSGARLSGTGLDNANLSGANLSGAYLAKADLSGAKLDKANLLGATLDYVTLDNANLNEANLRGARLWGANLYAANFNEANLSKANLREANFRWTNLGRANLSGANLFAAHLIDSDLTGADLTSCHVFGISTWRLNLKGAKQRNLVITSDREPEITVDNIEVAQFIYLLLNNQKLRDVINTITSKVVLILGRFTDERKAVLDALRDELRNRDYLPILFDFAVPARRNITETVTLLARMARFIIADLTDPSSIPQELQAIIPSVRVPVQPVLLEGSSLYSMFKDFEDYPWVLPVHQYKESDQVLAALAEKVIAPAEGKAQALAERRRMSEAELTKPR